MISLVGHTGGLNLILKGKLSLLCSIFRQFCEGSLLLERILLLWEWNTFPQFCEGGRSCVCCWREYCCVNGTLRQFCEGKGVAFVERRNTVVCCVSGTPFDSSAKEVVSFDVHGRIWLENCRHVSGKLFLSSATQ